MDIMNETIYNLIDQLPKTSLSNSKQYYQSIFNSNVLHNLNENKHSHRTMGVAIVPKPDPSNPLRRRQNYVELPEITPFIRPHRMPPIPKVNYENKNELKPLKNFIKENKTKIINSLPICPRRYVVSDRKGNKYLIDGSGLQKEFIYKKNYGKIPLYLQTHKIVPEQPNCDTNPMNLLPPEERLCLINNLKDRYKDILCKYQRLPLHLESPSAIRKETSLTNELVEIEDYINLLEKHQQIYILSN